MFQTKLENKEIVSSCLELNFFVYDDEENECQQKTENISDLHICLIMGLPVEISIDVIISFSICF